MQEQNKNREKMHYRKLAIMTALSFISMYILMYSMVNSIDTVYNNANQAYMAGVMTAPMVIIGILVMSSMYTDKRLNLIIMIVSVIALLLFFFFIRQQTAIGDTQFLRSMIPHQQSLCVSKPPFKIPRSKLCVPRSSRVSRKRLIRWRLYCRD